MRSWLVARDGDRDAPAWARGAPKGCCKNVPGGCRLADILKCAIHTRNHCAVQLIEQVIYFLFLMAALPSTSPFAGDRDGFDRKDKENQDSHFIASGASSETGRNALFRRSNSIPPLSQLKSGGMRTECPTDANYPGIPPGGDPRKTCTGRRRRHSTAAWMDRSSGFGSRRHRLPLQATADCSIRSITLA